MLKLLPPLTMLLALTVFQGCTSISAKALTEPKLDATNQPGGTVDCISPKIVTEEGNCEEPKKLSWM